MLGFVPSFARSYLQRESLEKSKNVLEEKRKIVKRKICEQLITE